MSGFCICLLNEWIWCHFLVACLFMKCSLTVFKKDPHNMITCKKKLYCVQKINNRFVLVTTQDTYQINILYLSF